MTDAVGPGDIVSGISPRISQALKVIAFFCLLHVLFFSSVIFRGRLLAPGDGFVFYFPSFYLGHTLWDPAVQGGFPISADPQSMTWYPLLLIFSSMNSWNGFVLSAYVLASSFTFGYVYCITRSRFAAIFSGIAYGLSGFIVAHLGHTTIIHAAAWLPGAVWAMHSLVTRPSLRAFCIASVAGCFAILAGHLQISLYVLSVAALYGVVTAFKLHTASGTAESRSGLPWNLKPAVLCGGVLICSAGLSAIQLLPARELGALSLRSAMTFQQFVRFSLPPAQIPSLYFPYLFGGSASTFYKLKYFGAFNMVEVTGYTGFLPILMSLVCVGFKRTRIVAFWAAIALFSFLLALGDGTFLANVLFHVPFFNKFRAPVRHFMEMSFALSVLGGLGVAAVQNRMVAKTLPGKALIAGAAIFLVMLSLVYLDLPQIAAAASSSGQEFKAMPWFNPAIGVPIVVFVLSAAVFLFWAGAPGSRIRAVLLLATLMADLAGYGAFSFSYSQMPEPKLLEPPEHLARYRALLTGSYQRMAPFGGVFAPMDQAPPNVSRIWRIPSASNYGPLMLSRVNRVLQIPPWGGLQETWGDVNDHSLDLMAVRYVFLRASDIQPRLLGVSPEMPWNKDPFGLTIGAGCEATATHVDFHFSAPISMTEIGIVSALGCSLDLEQNAPVMEITVTDQNGNSSTLPFLAGRDSAEMFHECADVLSQVKHGVARIYDSTPILRNSVPCTQHHYVATLKLPGPVQATAIKFRWQAASGAIVLSKVTLRDSQTGTSYAITAPMASLSDPRRWRHVENVGDTAVFENLQAMPRAWFVKKVSVARPNRVVEAIQTSRTKSGIKFNPLETAFLEEPLRAGEAPSGAEAVDVPPPAIRIIRASGTEMNLLTTTFSNAFLVVSDINYPGWKASIDGLETQIHETDYMLRGISVPRGHHTVHFEFRPSSTYLGAGISGSVLAVLLLLMGMKNREATKKKRLHE